MSIVSNISINLALMTKLNVQVAQLASSESALLASRAELGAERTNALVERRTRAVLEAETAEFQAEKRSRIPIL